MARYSRRSRLEERKNIRRAIFFIILTIVALLSFLFLGLPTIVKFSALLSDIRKSGEPISKDDQTPPVPPRLDVLPESTNEKSIEIKGTTESGVTVILYLNDKNEEILANSEGDFTYSYSLRNGINTISAISKDKSGNESQKSNQITVDYDIEPPELNISNPEDGSEYYGSKQRQVVIEGNTEGEAKVTINDRVAIVESDGNFSFTTTLSEGDNSFTIKAEDKAGNTTETSLNLKYSL